MADRFTTTELDKIDRILVSGADKVRHADGRSVEYRSADELMSLRRRIVRRLRRANRRSWAQGVMNRGDD